MKNFEIFTYSNNNNSGLACVVNVDAFVYIWIKWNEMAKYKWNKQAERNENISK